MLNKTTNNSFWSDFFNTLVKINLRFNMKNLNYLPRWMILVLDISIVLISSVITIRLFNGLNLEYISSKYFSHGLVFYVLINLFFFWIFKTYSGIIRHSSYTDALKLFFAQFATFIFLIVLNTIILLFDKHKFFLTTGAFINSVLSFTVS